MGLLSVIETGRTMELSACVVADIHGEQHQDAHEKIQAQPRNY
jgi:hypothetical protein